MEIRAHVFRVGQQTLDFTLITTLYSNRACLNSSIYTSIH